MKKLFLVMLAVIPMYLYSQVDTTNHLQILSGYYNDIYSEPYSRVYNVYYTGFGYKSPKTSIFGKVNYNTITKKMDGELLEPSTNGFQYELDYYQRLTKSTTSWWNYAYSNDMGFPNHRAMMRIWQQLPKSFLISGGASFYNFGDNNVFFINTGLEKYFGNYWIEYKLYTFFKEPEVTYSHHLTSRMFIKDINYLQFRLSTGSSDDEPWDLDTYNRLQAHSVGLSYVTMLGKRFQFRTGINYTYEKYRETEWRNRYSAFVGLTFNLN